MSGTLDPMLGHVLDGRYEILAKLARGGMATVYRARDRRLQRIVAVKIMRADLGEDDEYVAKFDREARAAAYINHPAVVSIFDQGTSQGQPYIVMEFVDGETLRRRISREAPMVPLKALDYLEPIAQALAAAHEADIVHRDIKPENVLISSREQVKVADFGLARETHAPQMTATGVLVGTASYLPPELVTHSRPDARSDVYSTGVLFFELLTGRKPHTGENNYQIAYKHVNVDVPKPSEKLRELELPGFIPDYVDALVAYCTARDRKARLRDGKELIDAIRLIRHELVTKPGQHNPKLAAWLRPSKVDPEAPTLEISPKPEPRPRPLTEVPAPQTSAPEPEDALPTTAPVSSDAVTTMLPTSAASPEPAAEPTQQRIHTSPALPSSADSAPRSQRTPLFPHINFRNDPIYRRRRIVLVVALAVVLAAIGIAAWWFSDGRYTTMPQIGQVSLEQAVKALEANDLKIEKIEEYSETVPQGQVISTDPANGQRVPRGSNVKVVLSRGAERYNMPDVAGMTVDEAKAAIESANLKVGEVKDVWSPTVAKGIVVNAGQSAGTPLPRGTQVTLEVSQGPEPIQVRNFEGSDAAEAQKKLEGLGLTVVVEEEYSATVGAGLVISQNPNSGTLTKGNQVALVKSKGPEMVEVPDVMWKKREEAELIMKQAGLVPEFIEAPVVGSIIGWVTGTNPGSGSQVAKGSIVRINLG